ncbi:MAG TPA: ATP synthase F0 subunit B [Geobacteraceae bacterium]
MKQRPAHTRVMKPALITAAACLLLVGLAAAGFAAEEAAHGAAEHGSHAAAQMKDFMWRCIDFLALVAILVWALKKADLKGSLKARQSGIEKALQEAVIAREAAEKKMAEYEQKLTKANEEIDAISAAIREEGQKEKARIIAEASATAEKIKEQARNAADQEIVKARAELRAEAAKLAVQLAEQTLREKVEKSDQDRLVGEYLTKVVELH